VEGQTSVIQLAEETVTETFIQIIDVGYSHQLITAIEVLSLANRLPGDAREVYRRRQRELTEDRVSVVEINLLRAGGNLLSVPLALSPPSPYWISVRRGWKPEMVEIYRAPLREPLPTISVPLRERDKDVPLDLQGLIELCYRNGRYDDLDYRQPPAPPLEPADEQWADELLRSRGLR
jgi:hypothetical protein